MSFLVLRRPRDGKLHWFQLRVGFLLICLALSSPLFFRFGRTYWRPWYQRPTIEYFQNRRGARVGIMYAPFELAQTLDIERDHASEWDDTAMAPIANLTTLTSCKLDGTAITDRTLVHLSKLNDLLGLHLSDTAVTDAGVKELVKHPSLRTLYLNGTDVTDDCLDNLARMPKLRAVGVRCTYVTEEGAQRLREMVTSRKFTVFHGDCHSPNRCRRHRHQDVEPFWRRSSSATGE